jgi:hypothetical protein
MTDRELMQQALEALENTTPTGFNMESDKRFYAVITALRERLAQPEQCQCPACKVTPHASDCAVHNEPAYPKGACDCGAQPEQEPVAWLIWLHGPAGHFDHKQFAEMEFERRNKEYPDPDRKLLSLYTSPPASKPWVGLTDDELHGVIRAGGYDSMEEFARAIEAKLKEKNG